MLTIRRSRPRPHQSKPISQSYRSILPTSLTASQFSLRLLIQWTCCGFGTASAARTCRATARAVGRGPRRRTCFPSQHGLPHAQPHLPEVIPPAQPPPALDIVRRVATPRRPASDCQHTLPPQTDSLNPVPLKIETLPHNNYSQHPANSPATYTKICTLRVSTGRRRSRRSSPAPARFTNTQPPPYNAARRVSGVGRTLKRNQFSGQTHSAGESQHTP